MDTVPIASVFGIEQVALARLGERFSVLRLKHAGEMAALRRSIARDGLLRPLIANRTAGGDLEVLDGFKRLAVLRELGWEEATVQVVVVDEAMARLALLSYNRARGRIGEIEEGWIVQSMVRGLKLAQKRVAELAGRHKSWVCRRLLLVERLGEAVQKDLRLGLLSAAVAREIGRLPRGNQAEALDAVRRHALGSRQTAALVERWFSYDSEEQRRALLADPVRILGAGGSRRAVLAADPRLSTAAAELRRHLLWLSRSSSAAAVAFERLGGEPLSGADIECLGALADSTVRLWAECGGALGALRGRLNGRQPDDGASGGRSVAPEQNVEPAGVVSGDG